VFQFGLVPLSGPIHITKKNNKNPRKVSRKPRAKFPNANGQGVKKTSLARQLATAGLGSLGGYLGGPLGASVGAKGAGWLSDVLGFGDYEIKSNSVLDGSALVHATTNVSGVPKFNSTKHSVRLSNREYLGDISSTVAFADTSFAINPGLATSFPWLSSVAANFQQYKFHGLLYEFVSTSANALNSTNTALGTVIMSTQYNAMRAAFTSKLEMEQYEFACSGKPAENLLHPVECSPNERVIDFGYVRDGAVPSGEVKQFYDLGLFQIATVGMQAAAVIGELWVTYDIELLKPRINPGGLSPGLVTRIANGGYTNTNILGSIQVSPVGNLGATIFATGGGFDSILIPSSISAGRLLVNVTWFGTAAVLTLLPPVLTNLTLSTVYRLGTIGQVFAPQTGVTASTATYLLECTVDGYRAAGSTIVFPNGSIVLPSAGADVDIQVVVVPLSDSFI